jgi:putative transposase
MSQPVSSAPRRWALLRFSIIGPLLAAPPEHGELQARVQDLARKTYQHPVTLEPLRFGASTIERWFYMAKDHPDPLLALTRKVSKHAGHHPAMSAGLCAALELQYRQHKSWSYQLHHDNLLALAKDKPALGLVPSYTTTLRYMRDMSWLRRPKVRPQDPEQQVVPRETLSFEASHVHALWHLDFHQGSRKVLCPSGQWKTPQLLGVIDDHSRLCCHLQWYLDETAQTLVHGLSQAIQKRGLPRALLTDNGAAMVATETQQGLARLGIVSYTTLPRSPEQNAKQEVFWAQVEGRLLSMLEGETELTLDLLNEATQAWVEGDYQRRRHDELGDSPLERALQSPSLVRKSPCSEELRRAFRTQLSRTVRRSDGTFTVAGVRFQLPLGYRTLLQVVVRVARWDLSSVHLCDPKTEAHLCVVLPLDKRTNADGKRRPLPVPAADPTPALPPAGIAPYLRQLMAQYAQTGLPPAYLPTDELTSALPALEDDTPEQADKNPSAPPPHHKDGL